MKLAVSLEPTTSTEQTQNALTPFFQQIVTCLLENTAREDFQGTGVDLHQASYVSMTSLVQSSCSDSHAIVY